MKFSGMKHLWVLTAIIGLGIASSGCDAKSYPSDHLKESLLEICSKEYGIEQLDVKIVGKTIGVYLPLKQLFATDFKEAMASGKVNNVETLFEPSEEALSKVEDVLFSISRVILSTDKDLEFYILQATDVEQTGLQLVLKGFVNDIKRVRVWDIPRSEYRKRVIHELRLNQAVIWHRPIKEFLNDLPSMTAVELRNEYFDAEFSEEMLQDLFFDLIPSDPESYHNEFWEVLDMRSTEMDRRGAVVYVKLKPADPDGLFPEGQTLEYLFLVRSGFERSVIERIIPFQFKDNEGKYTKIDFPLELQVDDNISRWKTEFIVEPVLLGSFLANQLTRRVQGLLSMDERIRNTFREARLEFGYDDESAEDSHFTLALDARLRETEGFFDDAIVLHEDMIYLLELISREFVDVLRSYRFGEYQYLRMNVAPDPTPIIMGRDRLELFRRNKTDFQGLIANMI